MSHSPRLFLKQVPNYSKIGLGKEVVVHIVVNHNDCLLEVLEDGQQLAVLLGSVGDSNEEIIFDAYLVYLLEKEELVEV